MRDLLERHKDWDGDPYEALMVEYVDPTTGAPVFKTMTFFAQMLRPGERTRPLRQTANLLVAPFEGQGHSARRRQAFRLEGLRHCRRAGRRLVRARQRLRPRSRDPVRRERRAGAARLRPAQEMGSRGFRRRRAPSLIPPTGAGKHGLPVTGQCTRSGRGCQCRVHITLRFSRISTVPAAARSGSRERLSMSATCAGRVERRSTTSPIPASRG